MRFAMLAQPEVAMDQYSNGKIVVGEGVTDSNDTSTACVFRKDWILPRKDFVPAKGFLSQGLTQATASALTIVSHSRTNTD